MNAVLTWNANTDAAVGYMIYRMTNPPLVDEQIMVPGENTTSYTFTGLADGIVHHFVIAAYDSLGNLSNQSTEVSKSSPAPSLRRCIVMAASQR